MAAKTALQAFEEKFSKTFGEHTLTTASESHGYDTVSTGSLTLDYALGVGGYVLGRLVEIYGVQGIGKTTMTFYTLADAQTRYPDKLVAFIDIEQKLDIPWMALHGVDLPRCKIFRPTNAEDVADALKDMIRSGLFSVIVLDSIGAMIPEAEKEKDADQVVMARQAKVITRMVKIAAGEARVANTLVLMINQLRCLEKGTMIWSSRGLLPIEQITVGDLVAGPEGMVKVLDKQESGVVQGYEIELLRRPPLTVSYNHQQPVLVSNGQIQNKLACELTIQDWLVQPINLSVEDQGLEYDLDLAYSLGVYFADGYLSYRGEGCVVQFTEVNKERNLLVRDIFEKIFPNRVRTTGDNVCVSGRDVGVFLNLVGHPGNQKVIPECILRGNRASQIAFIRGASFDTHGFGGPNHFIWTFETFEQAEMLAHLLRGFGIFGDLTMAWVSKHDSGWRPRLMISGDDKVRYAEQIGFLEHWKQIDAETASVSSNARGKIDVVPSFIVREIVDLIVKHNISGRTSFPGIQCARTVLCKGTINMGRKLLLELCVRAAEYHPVFKGYCDLLEHNRFVPISGLHYKEFLAYDLQVDGGLFVANGVVTHNSNLSGFGKATTTGGGWALRYSTTQKLEMKRTNEPPFKARMADGEEVQVGHQIAIKVERNAVAPAYRTAFVNLFNQTTEKFGPIGIDKVDETALLGLKTNVITRAGAWYTLPDKRRFNGRDELIAGLRADPKVIAQLRVLILADVVKEIFDKEVIEPVVDEEDDIAPEPKMEPIPEVAKDPSNEDPFDVFAPVDVDE